MTFIIRTEDLRKVYRVGDEKIIALDKIDLGISKGEICCILGTSGSGKSTLLNMLAGLEKPSKGEVYIGNTPISKLNENELAVFRQRNLGFIFQSYNLISTLNALENVTLPMVFKGVDKRERERKAIDILRQVGLGKRLFHKPYEMSGGQQQRVGIARAFVTRPAVIFADEPTGNLDSKTTEDIMNLMISICRESGQTLAIVTHQTEVSKFADRVITLKDGKVIKDNRMNEGEESEV